jgi:carbonic anhydrase
MGKHLRLLLSNKAWAKERTSINSDFFSCRAEFQQPEYLWIGCSDSRVPAEEVTGCEPGELFVHRNIANLVVYTDFNLLSVLQYAVEVLQVKHVIVCGHYGCGGILNAMNNKHLGLINKWLRHIKDIYRFHERELNAIQDHDTKFKRLVELNVIEQVYNLAETSIVQKAWNNNKELFLHGWVYDLKTGLLNELAKMEKGSDVHPIYRYNFGDNLPKTSEEI